MGERRSHRRHERTDRQIIDHPHDVFLLDSVERGRVVNGAEHRRDLRRLAREELVLCGFAVGSVPRLLPRGVRVLAAARDGGSAVHLLLTPDGGHVTAQRLLRFESA